MKKHNHWRVFFNAEKEREKREALAAKFPNEIRRRLHAGEEVFASWSAGGDANYDFPDALVMKLVKIGDDAYQAYTYNTLTKRWIKWIQGCISANFGRLHTIIDNEDIAILMQHQYDKDNGEYYCNPNWAQEFWSLYDTD